MTAVASTAGSIVPPARRPRPRSRGAQVAVSASRRAPYLNRELSWLEYSSRVLHEAPTRERRSSSGSGS